MSIPATLMESPPALARALIERYQRMLPLEPTPYAAMARALAVTEAEVIEALRALRDNGVLSRVGPVLRPHTVGASTLAAVAVDPARLETVARLVDAFPEVNHNYEREHAYNLWFVATGPDQARVHAVLDQIERRSGCRVLDLPMIEAYHIDLAFDNVGGDVARSIAADHAGPAQAYAPSDAQRAVLAGIQRGLALEPRPFRDVAGRTGLSEDVVIQEIDTLMRAGVIKRMGLVVRNRELGYRANAMVVWDVPDAEVTEVGRCLARMDFVSLCYRRPRRPPAWPYNLFCMIHGRHRDAVLERVAFLTQHCEIDAYPHAVLFSARRFKQRGACYFAPAGERTSDA